MEIHEAINFLEAWIAFNKVVDAPKDKLFYQIITAVETVNDYAKHLLSKQEIDKLNEKNKGEIA